MPTLEQLRAEPWWDREIVTAELDWLGDEICRRTGRPRTAAGTKGDVNHLRGAHRSQEWILNSHYCTSRTYTVQSGLTATQARHIAGFDFTPGSATQMIAQCQRLMAAVKAGGLEEVREFYGNVDGDQVVDGWNNVANRAAGSDSSHLWHWHLTLDRRRCSDRALMERILATALGDDVSYEDVWRTDKMRNPYGDAATNPTIWAETFAYNVGKDTAATKAAVARLEAQVAALAGKDLVDEQAIVAGVLAGLSPQAIADLVVAALPPDLARQTADVIAARLQS